ncbi:MAG TPA: hypothetical protein VNA32_07120 [Actinomycetota bacterium]|nr:hypothetical protein [Actinomycetota bacterium]
MSEELPGRIGILRPLRLRDFALLWTGMAISMVGDGVYVVAIAWQVYEISNRPPRWPSSGWPGRCRRCC